MALKSLKVADISPKKNLVVLSTHDGLETAFGKLFENRILSAPVIEPGGKVAGILSTIDIAVFAVNLAKTSQSMVAMLGLPVDHPELLCNFDNIPELFTGDKRLDEAFGSDPTTFMKNFSRRNPTTTVSYAGSWYDVVTALTKVRRVVVIDAQGALVNYITQSDMIKLLSERKLLGEKSNKSIGELKLGTSPVHSIKESQRIIEAFKAFALHEIEAVPVLDDSGKVVGNVSASDIRVMEATADAIDSLYLSYHDFREKMAKHNVPPKPITVTSSATMAEVVALLLKNRIHRVYVVDAAGKLQSVVSMTDILKAVDNGR